MGVELFAHQQTALDLLRVNDGFALFMEQGTGKTFPVLFRLAELAASGHISSALVVAPKYVCASWADKVALLDEGRREALASIDLRTVSYDLAWRREEYRDGTWDALVCDESHYLKSHTARRTKACLEIALRARYRWILTGTPTGNGQLCNLYSQLAVVSPARAKRSVVPEAFSKLTWSEWLREFAVCNQWHQPYKYLRVDYIQQVLGAWSYRVTKEECLDLPEVLPDEVWDVPLPREAAVAYRKMAKDSCIPELDELGDNALTRLLKLRQIAAGILPGCEHRAKAEALRELLSERDGKVVVFCDFRASIDRACEALSSIGWPHEVLCGGSDPGVVRRFREDPACRAIVCQYQSGGAGVDLQAADCCVFYEPCCSSTLHSQARDRIHRIGQRSACSYFYLLAEGTVERAMYRALKDYADFNEALFLEHLTTYTKRGLR